LAGTGFTVGIQNDPSCGAVVSISFNEQAFAQSVCNTPLISTTFGTDTFGPGDGIFKATLVDTTLCQLAAIDTVNVTAPTTTTSSPRITLSGSLSGSSATCNNLSWSFGLQVPDLKSNELQFDAGVFGTAVDRVVISLFSSASEEIYGLGEQFSFLNLKGRSVPVITQEGGIGRGLQPITYFMNNFGNGAGGCIDCTYSAVPQFISSGFNASQPFQPYAFYLRDTTSFTNFDLSQSAKSIIRIDNTNKVSGSWILSNQNTYLELISLYTGLHSGRQQIVPEWTGEGLILGVEGGSQNVYQVLDKVTGYGIPVVASWMQDWAGVRNQTIAGQVQNRVWFNWEWDDVQYPNWPEFVSNLTKRYNARSLVYVNSFLADVTAKTTGYKKNYYKIAESLGYLIRNSTNQTYIISSGAGFTIGLMDFTNRNAVSWFQNIIRNNVFGVEGVKGYMADFGEYLPMDSILSSGVDPKVYHNQFPDDWASLNSPFLTEFNDSLIFHRSWNSKTPSKTNMIWLGDQLPSYDSNDGLQSAIIASLGSGFSGMAISHHDIGGFTIVKGAGISVFTRTEELLSRWMEVAAFSPLFRNHPGSVRTDLQIYDSANLLKQLNLTVGLFVSLQPYRRKLIQDANQYGYPFLRPMVMQFPNETKGYWNGITYQQYMMGDSLLVGMGGAEKAGVTKVTVKLPTGVGRWVELWSQGVFEAGSSASVGAVVGRPPIFVRENRIDGGLLDGLVEFVAARR
ncbi:hypothetical protein HDU76_002985, partial [Blyttiomyces sp. JEL0837]